MKKRWKIRPSADEQLITKLSLELGVDAVIANLLIHRGITSFEQAKKFFRPSLDDLHDPFLMKDMDKAIDRINQAFEKREKILVYGDYDVDGTTAVALVYSFLKKMLLQLVGADAEQLVDYYIPDRYNEGYGISFRGIDYAKENNFSLIIALDCGIKSLDKIEYANENEIDFIICDHHRPGDVLPQAVAVLDPKRTDCNYPYNELSGCGIGFKLAQAFVKRHHIGFDTLMEYIDLTAISIASDLVPITGENRILCYYGLEQINQNPRKGISAILDIAAIKKEITINELVFTVGPRINAAGRIDSGRNAVALLISDTPEEAKKGGISINEKNQERRFLDQTITQQAFCMILEDKEFVKRKSTVLFHSEWHKGVIGIVASRLIDKFYKPTIILTESNGKATGSARSVKDFDIYDAISACSDLLEQYGGHKYAAGLTLKLENIEAFQKKFETIVSQSIKEHQLTPEIEIDSILNLKEITPKFYRILKQFAPFGPENMSPVFIAENIMDNGGVRIVGSNHLKMDLRTIDDEKQIFPSIAFGQAVHFDTMVQRKAVNICYSIEENNFNGTASIQLNVKDIRADGL